jgi:hypothetical protein
MTDPFAAFYPGSKRKRHDVSTTTSSKEVADWELMASKKTYPVAGRRIHLYRISALATALGKSEITIRSWISNRYLPNAPIRLPAANATDDKKRGAHRMFTREMIKSAVDSFDKRGLLGVPRVEWNMHPDLPKEILADWQRITKEAFTPAPTTTDHLRRA